MDILSVIDNMGLGDILTTAQINELTLTVLQHYVRLCFKENAYNLRFYAYAYVPHCITAAVENLSIHSKVWKGHVGEIINRAWDPKFLFKIPNKDDVYFRDVLDSYVKRIRNLLIPYGQYIALRGSAPGVQFAAHPSLTNVALEALLWLFSRSFNPSRRDYPPESASSLSTSELKKELAHFCHLIRDFSMPEFLREEEVGRLLISFGLTRHIALQLAPQLISIFTQIFREMANRVSTR